MVAFPPRRPASSDRPAPRYWSPAEEALLAELVKERKTRDEIAARLGRTPKAVVRKLARGPGAGRERPLNRSHVRLLLSVEGILADRADRILSDAVLHEIVREHGLTEDAAYDLMTRLLAALFPDHYEAEVRPPTDRLVPRDRAPNGASLAGLARLERAIRRPPGPRGMAGTPGDAVA